VGYEATSCRENILVCESLQDVIACQRAETSIRLRTDSFISKIQNGLEVITEQLSNSEQLH